MRDISARIRHKSSGLVVNEDLGLRNLAMNNAFDNTPHSVERTLRWLQEAVVVVVVVAEVIPLVAAGRLLCGLCVE